MALRLTLALVVVIFLVMRFADEPGTGPLAPDVVDATPDTSSSEDANQAPTTSSESATTGTDSRLASETATVIRLDPTPSLPEGSEPITLAPPASLAPDTETAADSTSDSDPFESAASETIAEFDILPEGLATGGAGGLGAALDLRDQVDAALEAAQEPPSRPSLAELAQPGGGQTQTAAVPEEVPSEPIDGRYAEVTATAVNLRGGPSTLNAVVGRVSRGDVLEILGEHSGGWSSITHPNTGETAYISTQFLSPVAN
ncbi:MAG: SH3 domain-containing protein [Pseudomonadota bacterium]